MNHEVVMALTKCKDCGREISKKAKACPYCGRPVKKRSKFLTGCLLIIVGLSIIGFIVTIFSEQKPASVNHPPTTEIKPPAELTSTVGKFAVNTDTGEYLGFIKGVTYKKGTKTGTVWYYQKQLGSKQNTIPVNKVQVVEFTDDIRLHLAKDYLDKASNSLKRVNTRNKSTWKNLSKAEEHLKLAFRYIKREDSLYKRASSVKNKINQTRKIISRLIDIEARKEFAKQIEAKYLNKGMDVYVTVTGRDYTTLKLKYVLFSRSLVHKIMNSAGFVTTLKSLGFKRVIFTDGYDDTWSYTIE